jgi:iron complex outermembrane recepter protein
MVMATSRPGLLPTDALAQDNPRAQDASSGASNADSVYIRGIGQSDFAFKTEAGVGTYVDGVYLSHSLGGVLDVLDVERIGILRGPRAHCFGRNTIEGAVSIVSKEPGDEFSGPIEARKRRSAQP